MATVSFGDLRYGLFHQRELGLEHEGQITKGSVDGLLALGAFDPEVPFFFIHEYKKIQGYDADPEGQLLIAMVAAQRCNNDGLPIYGCYIIDTYWRFVLLEGSEYAVSQGYDATEPTELRIIWRILHHTKQITPSKSLRSSWHKFWRPWNKTHFSIPNPALASRPHPAYL